jgi:hypothetical protein
VWWWLQVLGLTAFVIFLVAASVAWRRRQVDDRRATLAWIVFGAVVAGAAAYALVATRP